MAEPLPKSCREQISKQSAKDLLVHACSSRKRGQRALVWLQATAARCPGVQATVISIYFTMFLHVLITFRSSSGESGAFFLLLSPLCPSLDLALFPSFPHRSLFLLPGLGQTPLRHANPQFVSLCEQSVSLSFFLRTQPPPMEGGAPEGVR